MECHAAFDNYDNRLIGLYSTVEKAKEATEAEYWNIKPDDREWRYVYGEWSLYRKSYAACLATIREMEIL